MTLEELAVMLEDLVNAERRKAVALEELVGLLQIAVEAYTLLDDQDDQGGEVEVLRCP